MIKISYIVRLMKNMVLKLNPDREKNGTYSQAGEEFVGYEAYFRPSRTVTLNIEQRQERFTNVEDTVSEERGTS
jgi:hypothetical protein